VWVNLAVAAPLNLVLAVAYWKINHPTLQYIVLASGVTALYFTDYFCNALACSLIYDQVSTGNATWEKAVENTKRSSGGILVFARQGERRHQPGDFIEVLRAQYTYYSLSEKWRDRR
jgi:hypothetical protein